MIKFCGNCGTTITEKELGASQAVESGNYVYCGKCADKLGFSKDPIPDDPLSQAGSLGDIHDVTDTEEINLNKMNLDLPGDVFQKDPGGKSGTRAVSVGDVRKSPTDKVSTRSAAPVGGGKQEVTCSACKVKLRIKKVDKPKKVRCPKCTEIFLVKPEEGSGAQAPVPKGGLNIKQEPLALKEDQDEVKAGGVADTTLNPLEPIRPSPDEANLTPVPGMDPADEPPASDRDATAPPPDEEQDGAPKEPMTRRTVSASRRSASMSSRRRSRGKNKKAAASGQGKGLLVLMIFVLALLGAPFILMGVSHADAQVSLLGESIQTKLTAMGIHAAPTADEGQGEVPQESDPAEAGPKKAEPEKAEPEKAEPEKAEPEKAEPEKAEPEKAEPEKAEPEKAVPDIPAAPAPAETPAPE